MINKIQALISTHLMIQGSEENSEELAQVHVVRRLLEPEAAAVVQVHGELGWESFAENLDSVENTQKRTTLPEHCDVRQQQ